MSETNSLNLCQRILAVMKDLDYIQKGKKTVNGQYRFVSHDQVTSALHPMLVKHGIVVRPSVRKITQEGNRTVVELDVWFINPDMEAQSFCSCFIGYGIDTGDKGPGKAISYAYKYALLKTFCLETGDDPDSDANASYEPEKCLEFDAEVMHGLKGGEVVKMGLFLAYSAEALNKHIEDVKREALKRPESFLKSFQTWNPKK